MPKFFCLQEAVEVAALILAETCRATSRTGLDMDDIICPFNTSPDVPCLFCKEDIACERIKVADWIDYLAKESVKLYQQKQDSKKERTSDI